MDIFISWSGGQGEKIANELRDWFPKAIQATKPWFSSSDIKSGGRWLNEVTERLERTNFGIICLTPESLKSEWVSFEAGALSKVVSNSYVCPLIFGLEKTDVKGPLSQFQIMSFNKTDFYKLVKSINTALEDKGLSDKDLDEIYETWWPNIELKINNIIEQHQDVVPSRSDSEILKEILGRIRGVETQLIAPNVVVDSNLKPNEIVNILEGYIERFNEPKTNEKEILKEKIDDDTLDIVNYKDSLTGLWNRSKLNQTIEEYLKISDAFSLMIIDLDHFRMVNDTFGHRVGDLLLTDVARRLEMNTDKSTQLFRLGGDEFVVLMRSKGKEVVDKNANKIGNELNQPFQLGRQSVTISASIGVSSYPEDSDKAESLLEAADRAMYFAKKSGGNQILNARSLP